MTLYECTEEFVSLKGNLFDLLQEFFVLHVQAPVLFEVVHLPIEDHPLLLFRSYSELVGQDLPTSSPPDLTSPSGRVLGILEALPNNCALFLIFSTLARLCFGAGGSEDMDLDIGTC